MKMWSRAGCDMKHALYEVARRSNINQTEPILTFPVQDIVEITITYLTAFIINYFQIMAFLHLFQIYLEYLQ